MIFVDTGAFLARYLPRDDHHRRATRSWKALVRRDWKCYTSNFVLDETFTLLARRSSYSFAADRALVLLEKYAEQEVSFTYCVSFALMKRQHIRRAFAFNRHFKDAGFELWPA